MPNPTAPEKPPFVLHQQPLLMPPPPSYESMDRKGDFSYTERAPRRKRWLGSERGLSLKRHLRLRPRWSSSPRRPQISAPTNFRHLQSESFSIPDYAYSQPTRQPPRPSSFRPLHINFDILSPILPHLVSPPKPHTPPDRIIGAHHASADSSPDWTLSPNSFQIPRKPTPTGSVFDSPSSSVVKHPGPAHLRAVSPSDGHHPSIDDLIERIANAMLERDQIQDRIEDAVELTSVYTAVSRSPSIASKRNGSLRSFRSRRAADMEPMPDIPAMPPNAPSFSERLSYDRPRTAPSRTSSSSPHFVLPVAGTDFNFKQESPRRRPVEEKQIRPPLPLQYRPPLRKKKSFSRVGNWIGRQERPNRVGNAPITNAPLPVQPNNGYYEVVAANDWSRGSSYATFSDWGSDRDEYEDDSQRVSTSLASPYSSVTARTIEQSRPTPIDKVPLPTSLVGMAF
ncbi:uncharacterized protein PG998_003700 [Apiospora kogelbergensis]|uniref:Uncharacterized protein n=1 Tax=Apiospora kogelbergensis TaxID=1337665 RepID=A0AAW0QKK4_9PEZI